MTTDLARIKIHPIAQSRIQTIDFNNLPFGRVFSDHMFVADYANGHWQDLCIMPYGEMSYQPAMMSLHYGQSIFEGMKAYKNDKGDVLTFRPLDNMNRLNLSAERMCMPAVTEDVFMAGLTELLRIDSQWVPEQAGNSLYIRPFMYATDEYVGVAPSQTYRFIIFTCPVGPYYSKPVRVKVEEHYTRAAAGGVGFSKNAGNYGGSLYPAQKALKDGYDQLIWTDANEHKYVEEAGTMNFMFVLNNTLVTPATSDTVLDGITRRSVIQLAKDWGMKVEERRVSVAELIEAAQNGTLQEAFGAGTAAVISPIATIGYRGEDYEVPTMTEASFGKKVYTALDAIKKGRVADIHNWVYEV